MTKGNFYFICTDNSKDNPDTEKVKYEKVWNVNRVIYGGKLKVKKLTVINDQCNMVYICLAI